jgi:hypothetical protein
LIALLLDHSDDATRVTSDGSTPLHLLANRAPDKAKLAASVIDRLINAGIDVNATNGDGDTALHLCALSGNEPLARSLLGAPDVQPSIANARGETPLAYSQRAGTRHIAKLIATADARQLTTAPSTPKQGSPSATTRSSRANSDGGAAAAASSGGGGGASGGGGGSGLKIGQLLKTIGKIASRDRGDESGSDSERGMARRLSDGSNSVRSNDSPRDPSLVGVAAADSVGNSPLRVAAADLASSSAPPPVSTPAAAPPDDDARSPRLSTSGKTIKIRKRKDKDKAQS